MRLCLSNIFSGLEPMNLQNMSWDISTLEYEECFENISHLDKKPFSYDDEEASDEFIEQKCHDNPFADHPRIPLKTSQIVFVNKKQSINQRTWLSKMRQSIPVRNLVRSAQQLSGSPCSYRTGENCSLPTIGLGRSDAILRINVQTAASLLSAQIIRDFLFVDARFSYEYAGGHIRGAVNIEDEAEVAGLLSNSKILIFYCEFSSIRGPSLAQKLRNTDRQINEYPKLNCPEIYVLEGGYSTFYKEYPSLCDPRRYVRMHDKRFAKECTDAYKRKKCRKN